MLYDADSFFTLGIAGRIGLVCLNLFLSALAMGLVWYACAGLKRVSRVLTALLVFWGFVWLSPQIYYLYYIAIFDGLPWQIVVKSPPRIADIVRVFSFTGNANLSAHGQGVLGWAMVLTALLRRRG